MQRTAAIFTLALSVTLAACSHDGRSLRAAEPNQTASILTTPDTVVGPTKPVDFQVFASWEDGADILPEFTCAGANESPSVAFEGVPSSAKELVIVASDPDGTKRWIVAGIAPSTTAIAAKLTPKDAVQLRNDVGDYRYDGPCPAPGVRQAFVITAYALSAKSLLTTDSDPKTLMNIIDPLVIKTASITGYFTR